MYARNTVECNYLRTKEMIVHRSRIPVGSSESSFPIQYIVPHLTSPCGSRRIRVVIARAEPSPNGLSWLLIGGQRAISNRATDKRGLRHA